MNFELLFQKVEDALLEAYLFIRYFDLSDLEFLGFTVEPDRSYA
jgi:hypothetical protein